MFLIWPVESFQGVDGLLSVLEVNEGVVFDFLDSIDFAESLESFAQLLLGQRRGQVPNVQDFHLNKDRRD